MLPVTTAWLVALAEVVLLAWAVVAAVAGVSVLESRILVALAEAFGRAHGGGHRAGGE